MTRKSNMINNILKGWLNINKLVKIFIYDWHNCTSTAHVAQRGIFAIGFRIFLFASLLLARSPFPGFPPSKKARTGDKREWSNQRPRLQSNPVASSPTQPLGARQPPEPPRHSCTLPVPSSHLHASPLVRRNCLDRLGFV